MLLPLLLFFRFSRQGVCIFHAASIAAMVDPNPSAIHAIVSNMFMAHVTQVVTLTVLTAQADGATPVWNLPSCLVAISKGYPYAQKAFEPIISKADKG
jgi:hypothetical protein